MLKGAVFTAAECRAIAGRKLAQAEQDPRHRRRLITAAQAWLFLAGKLSGEDTPLSIEGVVKKSRSKKRSQGNAASTT
jgi:hypothetical protein